MTDVRQPDSEMKESYDMDHYVFESDLITNEIEINTTSDESVCTSYSSLVDKLMPLPTGTINNRQFGASETDEVRLTTSACICRGKRLLSNQHFQSPPIFTSVDRPFLTSSGTSSSKTLNICHKAQSNSRPLIASYISRFQPSLSLDTNKRTITRLLPTTAVSIINKPTEASVSYVIHPSPTSEMNSSNSKQHRSMYSGSNQQFTVRSASKQRDTNPECRPFLCSSCGAAFKQLHHLKAHEHIHSGRRPFSCHICSASFKQSVHLKVHEYSHYNHRPYFCTVCNANFKRSSHLAQHKRIHSTNRPFMCSVCYASFKFRSILKRHHQRMHS